jgi:hypothetical protein
VYRNRLRRPLRWLWAGVSTLFILVFAGIAGATWLIALIPFVAAALLFAPAVGVFRTDETPVLKSGVWLEASEVPASAPTSRHFRLALVNDGDVAAEDFRIRLLIPSGILPVEANTRPLGKLLVGEFGQNWFIDSAYGATAITLRTAPRGATEEIACPAHSRQELADLVLPVQTLGSDAALDYQVNGGTVKAALGRVRLEAATLETQTTQD